jgi:hypothetical protein
VVSTSVAVRRVAQVDAQQFAAAEAREQDLRIELRVGQGEAGERFFQLLARLYPCRVALAREPLKIVRVLRQRRLKQLAPGRKSERIGEQAPVARQQSGCARVLRRDATEEAARSLFVRQLSQQQLDLFVNRRQGSDDLLKTPVRNQGPLRGARPGTAPARARAARPAWIVARPLRSDQRPEFSLRI